MLRKIAQTNNDTSALVPRVLLGIVFLPHGLQKVFGMFGGHGFAGTMGFFTGSLGIPALFAFLAIVTEGLGSLGLITGLFTRLAAFGITATITVAAFMMHLQNGFFMNWFGSQKGEGFEYHLLALGLAVRLWRRGRPWPALGLLAALGLQLALGLGNVLLGWPLGLAVAHNAGAALLLATALGAHLGPATVLGKRTRSETGGAVDGASLSPAATPPKAAW